MKKLYKSLNFKTYQPHSKKYPNQTEPKTGLIIVNDFCIKCQSDISLRGMGKITELKETI